MEKNKGKKTGDAGTTPTGGKLKCGLEIHQRLATGRKLFCNCSPPGAEAADDEPSGLLKRRLRAVSGELGEIDPAAAFEAGRTREFHYQLFEDTTCLVEEDEQPPYEVDAAALEASLQVALLLGAKAIDEIHFMRKTVVDGSATGGFQRTGLVAVGGAVEAAGRRIGIQTVCLEEESAGIVEQHEGSATYRLDRLGIPLVEIATDASISSGEEARQTALAIGMMLRGTRKVARGIGTIRQDLNVSVEGGARVEVKGAQELELVGKIVENEAARQRWLLWIGKELAKRGVARKKTAVKSVVAAFAETSSNLLKNALEKRGTVVGLKLEGFAGLLGIEIMPGHRFGTELSDYAKAHAGVQGILHSDEDLGKYGISEAERQMVANGLGCAVGDAWVLCAGDETRGVRALAAVFERAMLAAEGTVPKETRRAVGEISKFMRPLPGAARMYPETDVPPVAVTAQRLEKARDALPQSPEKIIAGYCKMGLSKEAAAELLSSEQGALFEQVVEKTGADPVFAASTLLQTLKALKREGVAVEKIPSQEIISLFALIGKEKIVKSAVPEALRKMAGGASAASAVEDGLERLPFAKVAALAASGKSFEEIMREYRLVAAPEDVKKAVGTPVKKQAGGK